MPQTVVIVGNGVSGITAARFLRKNSDCRIVVVGSESDYFYSRTALMYIYMGQMSYEHTKPYEDWFWEKNRIELVRGHVESVDTDQHQVMLAGGELIRYDVLIMATGAHSVVPDWPGIELNGVQGLYGLNDLQTMVQYTRGIRRGVVVGGGLIGIELAEMLLSQGIDVTFIVRELSYMNHILPPAESELVNAEIREHGVDLRLGAEVARMSGDTDGRVQSVTTQSGDEIACEFAGVAIGVSPNVSLARRMDLAVGRGILVNEFFETSKDDVFAIGDCAEFLDDGIGHRRVEQLWYSGRRHGETVAQTIAGVRTAYDRGIFFNSAKFFNLEYQTYGVVPTGADDALDTVAWQHPSDRKLIRIAFDAADHTVRGFNAIGLRLRQETCERWIRQRTKLDSVVESLALANFDPEFTRRYEDDAAHMLMTN